MKYKKKELILELIPFFYSKYGKIKKNLNLGEINELRTRKKKNIATTYKIFHSLNYSSINQYDIQYYHGTVRSTL